MCVREKIDARVTALDGVTRKQLIWCGHVERMNPTRLPEIMINWEPEGWKKRVRSQKNLERWDTYSYEWKRSEDRRMEQFEGNGVWESEGVGRRFKTAQYICIYIYIYKF